MERKQKLTSLDSLYAQARETFDPFVSELEQFAEHCRKSDPEKYGMLEFRHSGLKTYDKAFANVSRKFGGDASMTLDLVRGSLVIPGAYLDDLVAEMDRHFKRAGKVEDRVREPNEFGYRDRQFFIEMPNGHICEVQCLFHEIEAVRKLTHPRREMANAIKGRAIEEGRLLTAEERRARGLHVKYCLAQHNKAAISAGINDRLDPDLPESARAMLIVSGFPVVDFAEVAPRGNGPEPVPFIDLEEGALDWLPDLSEV